MSESDKANPKTVEQIVNELIEGMSLEERYTSVYLKEEELEPLQITLAMYIGVALEKMSVRKEIMKDCIAISKDENLDEANAATVILKELWKRLRETHQLRVVK
jgi:hypothetical protein